MRKQWVSRERWMQQSGSKATVFYTGDAVVFCYAKGEPPLSSRAMRSLACWLLERATEAELATLPGCPWCGAQPVVSEGIDSWLIKCGNNDCWAWPFGLGQTREEAEAAWRHGAKERA